MTSKHHALAALVIANIIWGAAPPLFKWSLESISPLSLAFFRFLFATIIVFPFAYKHLYVHKEDIVDFLLIGIFGATLNIGLFFLSLQYIPSINAPLIGSSAPLVVLIVYLFVFHEKPKVKAVIGAIVGLIGVLIIIIQPILQDGFNASILGNVLLIASLLCGLIHLIVSKKVVSKYPAITITFYSFLIPIFTFFPFFLSEATINGTGYLTNTQAIIGILYGAIFASYFAHYLYYWAMKFLQAGEIALFAYVPPVVAVIVAFPLLGETLSPTYLVGAFFVFIGLYIAEAHIHYHPFHHKR